MTGLTVALRLVQHGLPVVVHERNPYLGGLASESTLAGVPIDRFYHCVLPADTALQGLFSEIGLKDAVKWRRTRTGFYHNGSMIEMTTSADFLRFPALSPVDRLRLGWTIAYCGMIKDWRRLEKEPVSHFLRRHGGERLFTSIWEPLLVAKLGVDYDRFAASFIWATISRMLSARTVRDRSEQLGFVSGRYGQVFAALRNAIETAGGKVMTGSSVAGISKSDHKSGWTVQLEDGMLRASGIVLCTPAPLASDWVEDYAPEAAAVLRKVDYLGVVCEVMLLRRSLSPYYVLNLTDRSLPFTGVVELTNLTGVDEFGGHTVVYLPRYCGKESALWTRHDADMHEENMAGLKRLAPKLGENEIVAWQIHRARHVQPVHRVGKDSAVPPVALAPGLAYCSTAQIHPWPVFNDAVVRHVDSQIAEVVKTLQYRTN
jgi:protoporphyrinogen oxidase